MLGCGLGGRLAASRPQDHGYVMVVQMAQGIQHQFASAKQTVEGSPIGSLAAIAHHVVELDSHPDVDLPIIWL